MEKKESKTFYVGLKDSIELRRAILSASREIIKCMDSSKKIMSRRADKKRLSNKLKNDLEEIDFLIDKLIEVFPKEKIETWQEKPKITYAKPKKTESTPPKRIMTKKDNQKITDLHEQLLSLEKKLGNL